MANVGSSRADSTAPTGTYGGQDADSISGVADALIEAVRINYGGRLSQAQLDDIRAGIHNQLTVAERLHQYPLANADEPAFGFAAYDGER